MKKFEIADNRAEGPKDLFDIVKVRDIGVRDTECNYE